MEFFKKSGVRLILVAIIVFQFLLLAGVVRWGLARISSHIKEEEKTSLKGVIDKALLNNKRWSQNLLETVSNISYIQENFHDRDELYDYSYPILNRLSKDGLSILNYYTPDGRLILKTGDPKDTQIEKRDLPHIANREDRIVFGIDEKDGKIYTFIAGPISSKGKKLGVIELGVNIKQLLAEVKSIFDVEAGIQLNEKIVEVTNDLAKEGAGKKDFKKEGKIYEVALSELNKEKGISLITIKDNTLMRKTLFRTELFIDILGLISVVIISIIIIKVLNPLGKIINTLKDMEGGDLRKEIEASTIKELATGINSFVYSLRGIIKRIQEVSEAVVSGAAYVDTVSEKLTKGTGVQVESTEVTSAAIGQMNLSIKGVVSASESLSQSADESSASVLEMTAAINQVAQSANTMNTIVEDTSSFITEMSASIKQIDENVDVLSSSAEETAAAVSEIAATIKGIEENVNESARLSEDVKKEASELGMKAIDKTVEGMNRIMKSVEASGNIIDRLGERSQHIGKVLTVIDDVTDQTNLLALNAAIIAAQAGEHGKGFAVVADEIKDLAERTVASTKEISQMIESIQKEVGEAVISMKESSENVTEGIELSKEAANALKKILERSDRSVQMSKEIERATKEQGRGVVQVSEEVHKITNMVRQIAHATQEQRKGSEQVMGSVEKMRDISRQVRQATIEQTKGSKQINDAVENVNQKVHAIVKATKEQSIGSEQIVTSVEKIRNITQDNIKFSSEIKERIEYLIKQAELLKGEVKRFVI